MYGYPGMLLLGPNGAGVPTTVIRGGALAFENITPTAVSLAPGASAYFNVGYSDVPGVPPNCSTASQLEITPPNDTAHVVVALPSGIHACEGGKLNVSAVFASTDASATQTTAPSLP